MTTMTLADDLRTWRLALGWTRKQAAEFLGVPLRTLEGWEQGRRKPDQEGPIRRLMELTSHQCNRSPE
jgi:Predicted transcriptional regulator